jgi:hypothetical protein
LAKQNNTGYSTGFNIKNICVESYDYLHVFEDAHLEAAFVLLAHFWYALDYSGQY